MNDSTWTWISGNDTINQPGVYGSKGIASTDNYPGARQYAVGCYDSVGKEFWLFSGFGFGNTSTTPGALAIV